MTHARDEAGPDIGLSYPGMDKVLSIIELAVYIAAILALSAAATWAVIKISPSEAAKQQRAKAKESGSSSP
jgi:hypothetical protein